MEAESQPNQEQELREKKRREKKEKHKKRKHRSTKPDDAPGDAADSQGVEYERAKSHGHKSKHKHKSKRKPTLTDGMEIMALHQAVPVLPADNAPERPVVPVENETNLLYPQESIPPPKPYAPKASLSLKEPLVASEAIEALGPRDSLPKQIPPAHADLPRQQSTDAPVADGVRPAHRRDRRAVRAAQAASLQGDSIHLRKKKEQELLDRLGQDVKDQLAAMKLHKPIFTYVTALAQVAVMVCALFKVLGGNTAVFSFKAQVGEEVVPGFFNPITQQTAKAVNMWYGPNDLGFLNYGAMFTPCMRDQDDESLIRDVMVAKEANAGCCVHANGLCGMMNETECGSFTFKGAGVDCTSVPECPSERIIIRPCVFGRFGDCSLLTEEHCQALGQSFFFPNNTLCTQVNPLEEVCGMFGFIGDTPDQFYRVFTSMFMHAGLIHLALNVVFQIKVVAELEEFCGIWRIAIMYFASGIGGNIIGAIFNPNALSAGSSGALYGMVGVMTVDLFNTWQMLEDRVMQLIKLTVMLVFMLGIGTLHFIDNWAHCGGFFVGILCGIAFLPYINFSKWDGRRKLVLRIIALVTLVGLAVLGVILFYETLDPNFCSWCHYINCVPYTKGFCDDNSG